MTMRSILLPSAVSLLSVVASANLHAQISVFQSSDGTSGTITQLGDNFAIYSDSHGNTGTITGLGGGIQSYSFMSPGGDMTTGTISTFGSPTPPNNLTPAPVLPFNPNGPLMPQQRIAPVVPFSPGPAFGSGSPSGAGRLGR
jgi:hypothetical protein